MARRLGCRDAGSAGHRPHGLCDQPGEDRLIGGTAWQMQADRLAEGFDADGEFDQPQAHGVELTVAPERAARHQGAQGPHQPIGAEMQEYPHLIGAGARAGGAIGGEMALPRFDMILGLAAGAVEIFVEAAR